MQRRISSRSPPSSAATSRQATSWIFVLVELDIERCRLLANAGLHWAKERDRIQAACKLLNLDEDQRTRETWGRSIVTLRSYRQVGREWRRYLAERRKVGRHRTERHRFQNTSAIW